MPELVLPFSLNGAPASVRVTLDRNEDPVRLGTALLGEDLPESAGAGFPWCEAVVTTEARGYRAVCGWVQVVRSTDASDAYELDPLSVFRDVETPFAFFGVAPTLFDAPFRETLADLDWTARSYLCVLPDLVMSKRLAPVVAVEWGFDVRGGRVALRGPRALPLPTWEEHRPLLSAAYPRWSFSPAG